MPAEISPKPTSQPIKNVLSIGGSDPSGGAGIQADLKTFAANGVYGMAVITALTAQNTRGVAAIHCPDAGSIEEQINCLFEDIQPDAVKIGMLANTDIIHRVATRLKYYQARNIIVDPVMLSSSGQALLDPAALHSLREQLLPIATLCTPNLDEAVGLLNSGAITAKLPRTSNEMLDLARQLHSLVHCPILVKGGHLPGEECPDVLIDSDAAKHWFRHQRIATANLHGTGCTLSAAIAANLARNSADLPGAVEKAKVYLSRALASADDLNVGTGAGPLHHCVNMCYL